MIMSRELFRRRLLRRCPRSDGVVSHVKWHLSFTLFGTSLQVVEILSGAPTCKDSSASASRLIPMFVNGAI